MRLISCWAVFVCSAAFIVAKCLARFSRHIYSWTAQSLVLGKWWWQPLLTNSLNVMKIFREMIPWKCSCRPFREKLRSVEACLVILLSKVNVWTAVHVMESQIFVECCIIVHGSVEFHIIDYLIYTLICYKYVNILCRVTVLPSLLLYYDYRNPLNLLIL